MLAGDLLAAIFERAADGGAAAARRRALREVAAARAALDGLERTLVPAARRDGVTWAEIAADLRVAPSTLADRYPQLRRPRKSPPAVAAS